MAAIKLTDTSIMPFGKYKGKQMQEVPDGYLLVLWDKMFNSTVDSFNKVSVYIHDNLDSLESDTPPYNNEY